MEKNIKVTGAWWLPDSPRKRINGTLTFSPETGCELEIYGVFNEKQRGCLPEQPTIILGISQEKKPITLYRCINTELSYPFFSLGASKYFAHFMFEGIHFKNESEICFHQLNIDYLNADSWIGISGFKFVFDENEDKITYKIEYSNPSEIIIPINDSLDVGIGFSCIGPSLSHIQSEVTINQKSILFARSKKGDISFEDLDHKLQIFCDLFQISIQRIPQVISFFGFSTKLSINSGKDKKYLPIEIYYQPIEYTKNCKKISQQEMLFIYKDLDIDQIKIWVENFFEIQTFFALYRSLFFRDHLFVETRFINISQALESAHSLLFENNFMPKKEFENRILKVLNLLQEEDRLWIKTIFSNANEKRFKQRIIELLNLYSYIFSDYIPDSNVFACKVRDTRNSFIHQSKPKYCIQDKLELHKTIELMKMIFESFLLDRIGFSNDKIKELMQPKLDTFATGWKHLRSIRN